jgi:F-type H+-transporting ATPase subunit b
MGGKVMSGLILIVAASAGEGGDPLVSADLTRIIWTVLTFLLLLLALRLTAWPKIVKALDERERKIQQRFDDAAAHAAAAEKKVSEYEARIERIEDDARQVLDKARRDAERLAEEAQAKSRAEMERMVERAKHDIRQAQGTAIGEFKAHAVDMVMKVSEQLLKEDLSEEQHRRFVDKCVTSYEEIES